MNFFFGFNNLFASPNESSILTEGAYAQKPKNSAASRTSAAF